uniref:Uncharacterized protein n=1 Tax=Ficedula albicollis TaxID=59894 RepID=A0A803W5C5_FICAL
MDSELELLLGLTCRRSWGDPVTCHCCQQWDQREILALELLLGLACRRSRGDPVTSPWSSRQNEETAQLHGAAGKGRKQHGAAELEHSCRPRPSKGCSQILTLSLLWSGFPSALWPSGLLGGRQNDRGLSYQSSLPSKESAWSRDCCGPQSSRSCQTGPSSGNGGPRREPQGPLLS